MLESFFASLLPYTDARVKRSRNGLPKSGRLSPASSMISPRFHPTLFSISAVPGKLISRLYGSEFPEDVRRFEEFASLVNGRSLRPFASDSAKYQLLTPEKWLLESGSTTPTGCLRKTTGRSLTCTSKPASGTVASSQPLSEKYGVTPWKGRGARIGAPF